MRTSIVASLLALATAALAAPATIVPVELNDKVVSVALVDDLPDTMFEKRAYPTILLSSIISSYTPYTWFASAAYCKPANTLAWNCGANCDANPGFIPIASGGDGALVQYWFVGYDPTLKTIIVSHQGADYSKIFPTITEGEIILTGLDTTLFPGIPSNVRVHLGFRGSHANTATKILAAVKDGFSTYEITSVTTVGHSLGGATSLLEAVYLSRNLPSSTTIKAFLYGQPRVGNLEFANYVDAIPNLKVTRITNKRDPVPIFPGRFLGFSHTSGEVHIDEQTESWYSCPGQENTSEYCTLGDVPIVFTAEPRDHSGPYNTVQMGC